MCVCVCVLCMCVCVCVCVIKVYIYIYIYIYTYYCTYYQCLHPQGYYINKSHTVLSLIIPVLALPRPAGLIPHVYVFGQSLIRWRGDGLYLFSDKRPAGLSTPGRPGGTGDGRTAAILPPPDLGQP